MWERQGCGRSCLAAVGNRGPSTDHHLRLNLEIWNQTYNKIDPGAWLAGYVVITEQRWGAD
ncbi:hypothetical protein [Nocardia salmonicida]|uniref:hypothetical protein n=1 Tax=Nocardia salmonicida TaxID=53431 RepID=UPI003404254D